MDSIKKRVDIVNYFLPRSAQLVMLKSSNEQPAILEADFDCDGKVEIIAVYKKGERHYLIGLKKILKNWDVVWNRAIRYQHIECFQTTHLEDTDRQEVAIAGKIDGMVKSQLMLIGWHKQDVGVLIEDYISFDKLYIRDVDGQDKRDEIVLWQHKVLEVYDIHIYRYQQNQLIEDTELEHYYYPEVVRYYEKLKEAYQEEPIYHDYLEMAKIKCDYKINSQIQVAWGDDLEEANQQEEMEFLCGMCAYLEEEEVEEDVYLMGRQDKEKVYFEQLQLVITCDGGKKNQMIRLEVNQVYDYEMRVGRFLAQDIEQVFIKVNAKTEVVTSQCWIIGVEHRQLYYLFRQEDDIGLNEDDSQQSGEGYVIDTGIHEPLMVGIKYNLFGQDKKQIDGYKLSIWKGGGNELRQYKTFVMTEQKGG